MSRSVLLVAVIAAAISSESAAQQNHKLEKIYFNQAPPVPQARYGWVRGEKSPFSKLEKAWLEADDEDTKDKISKKAFGLLADQFEEDMTRREEELEEVMMRVERLREQLAKRESKREDIIGLQLRQLTMSWEGLGWTDPHRNRAMGLFTAPVAPAAPSVTVTGEWLPGSRFPARVGTISDASLPKDRGDADADDDSIVEQIVVAAVRGNDDVLVDLARQLVVQTKKLGPVEANDMVWTIYEEVGDQVKNKAFWVTLAEATGDAADKVDSEEDPHTAGNVLDTAARCFFLGGKVDNAIKLQEKAVAASAEANGGTPDGQILEFLAEISDGEFEWKSKSSKLKKERKGKKSWNWFEKDAKKSKNDNEGDTKRDDEDENEEFSLLRNVSRQIIAAAKHGRSRDLPALANQFASLAKSASPAWVNGQVWNVYEVLKDGTSNEVFWSTMGQTARAAAQRAPVEYQSAILETAARCFASAGDFDALIKLESLSADTDRSIFRDVSTLATTASDY